MDPNQNQQANPQNQTQETPVVPPTQNQQTKQQDQSTAQPPQQEAQQPSQQTVSAQPASGNHGENAPPPSNNQNEEHGTSNTRNIIAILLLVFVPIIGLFYVLLFTKWPRWAKILLSVIFILPFALIMLAILLIAINPSRQFGQANDTQRSADVNAILNAVLQYEYDSSGDLSFTLSSNPQEISSNEIDICEELVGTYISALPVDPELEQESIIDCSQSYFTGYFIWEDNNRVNVSAPMHEGENEIVARR